ncbi:MAG: ABC transporter permease [Deltaproteobacteria bacterium]|nr:ABC transporter permease [Deltaproteobacteria bacterium]
MMNPVRIRAVARKELYHLMRDVRSLFLAFVIPLVLILLFGYALSLDVEHIQVVVVDHDRTETSRGLVERLDATIYFDVAARLPNTREAADRLDEGGAAAALIIPPGWTGRLQADRASPLQFLLDGSDPNQAGLARSYILAFVERENRELLLEFLNSRGREAVRVPVEGRIRVWFNEDLESRNFIIPGIIAIIIMIAGAILTSLVVAREYENGTMETIRTLPVTAGEFILGKAIPYFLIGAVDVLVAMLMGQLLFGVVMKSSFWLMVLGSGVYLAVALSLGLLISVGTKSQLVANQLAILITYLPSLLLSNFVFPVENMPRFLQMVTRVVPATYYIDILNGLYLRNLGLDRLWPSFVVLLIMFGVLVLLTFAMFRREGM